MKTIAINKIEFDIVKPLSSKAIKDKVCLKDTKTTVWFGAYDEKNLCGVAGSILKDGKGRIRGVFVLPEYRKLGIGSKLMEHIINYFKSNNACYIDQLSSNPNWWVKKSWKIKSTVKNGAWVYKNI